MLAGAGCLGSEIGTVSLLIRLTGESQRLGFSTNKLHFTFYHNKEMFCHPGYTPHSQMEAMRIFVNRISSTFLTDKDMSEAQIYSVDECVLLWNDPPIILPGQTM